MEHTQNSATNDWSQIKGRRGNKNDRTDNAFDYGRGYGFAGIYFNIRDGFYITRSLTLNKTMEDKLKNFSTAINHFHRNIAWFCAEYSKWMGEQPGKKTRLSQFNSCYMFADLHIIICNSIISGFKYELPAGKSRSVSFVLNIASGWVDGKDKIITV